MIQLEFRINIIIGAEYEICHYNHTTIAFIDADDQCSVKHFTLY
jgi:hypothetical protein